MDTGKNLKVLVVDDAYFMRELIIKALKEFGCEIVGEAKNGLEAIKMFEKYKPDLITMDIKMAEMNGIEAIKEIKKINPSVNIIVITGQYDMKKEALKSGADDFLKKPFQPAFLWQKIDKILEKKSNQKTTESIIEVAKPNIDQKYNPNENKEKSHEDVVIIESGYEDDLLSIYSPDESKSDNDVIFEIGNNQYDEELINETKDKNQNTKHKNNNIGGNVHIDKINKGGDKSINNKGENNAQKDEDVIMINIKPPRNIRDRTPFEIKQDREEIIEAPIINYIEESKEVKTSYSLLDKIKKILKLS